MFQYGTYDRNMIKQKKFPARDPNSPESYPRVPPEFPRTARRLLTVRETSCPVCALRLEYWSPEAKTAGK